MIIRKRVANRLKRYNYAEIGRLCDISRQAVKKFIDYEQRIPDRHIATIEAHVGFSLRK